MRTIQLVSIKECEAVRIRSSGTRLPPVGETSETGTELGQPWCAYTVRVALFDSIRIENVKCSGCGKRAVEGPTREYLRKLISAFDALCKDADAHVGFEVCAK